jgi:hypothetical protein
LWHHYSRGNGSDPYIARNFVAGVIGLAAEPTPEDEVRRIAWLEEKLGR